jgi:hypothetical protein
MKELSDIDDRAKRGSGNRRPHAQTFPTGIPLADDQPQDQMPANEDQIMQDYTDQDAIGSDQLLSESGEAVDEYPGAAETYGPGQTFMDRFDADPYAQHRESNLYYPFASKQDWEIGAFLERSRLSMAAIDEFLSLEMVCSTSFAYFLARHVYALRFNNFLSLSTLPKSCAAALSYFLPARNGNSKPCKLTIRLSPQFDCSIAIP